MTVSNEADELGRMLHSAVLRIKASAKSHKLLITRLRAEARHFTKIGGRLRRVGESHRIWTTKVAAAARAKAYESVVERLRIVIEDFE